MKTLPALLLVTALAAPLAAQEPDTNLHRGFWITFGLGGGQNTGTGFDGERLMGSAGMLRMGGSPNQKLLVGGETIFWIKGNDSRGVADFSLQWYPKARGLYLKGGVGSALATHTVGGSTTMSSDVSGFGAVAGLGYEFKAGRNFYLVPAVDMIGQWFEPTTDPLVGNVPRFNSIVVITIGALWH